MKVREFVFDGKGIKETPWEHPAKDELLMWLILKMDFDSDMFSEEEGFEVSTDSSEWAADILIIYLEYYLDEEEVFNWVLNDYGETVVREPSDDRIESEESAARAAYEAERRVS